MKDSVAEMPSHPSFRPGRRIGEFLRTPFPYYLNDDRKNTFLIAGIALFVLVFMLVFTPYSAKIFLVSAIVFVVMWSSVVLLPWVFPTTFDPANWTVGKYIVFSLWQLLMDGFFIAVALELLNIHPTMPFGQKLLHIYPNVLSQAVIPLAIGTLLLRNNILRENLRHAMKANQELEKIRVIREDVEQVHPNLVTIYSDTRESLQFLFSNLLYVEASENYSTLYWKNGQAIENRMLRINLKNVESQLDNHFTIRCHRSFLVNINAIAHVTGNANGYKLAIKGTGVTIPVSRSKGKEVMERIEQLRNVFELN
jgi:hypothetical protein